MHAPDTSPASPTRSGTVPATDAAILVEGLHKRYPGAKREAVAGIDLVVPRGEIFGLLGPNGAGKTTTIGTMTTRVRPTAGRVVVDGVDVQTDPVAAKLRLAVVPQRPNLDRSLSALENLTFHAGYFGAGRRERRERAKALLTRVGLEGREGDRVDKYSGGMAQRLIIARALMHDPQIVILDEPTTGLDPQSRRFLWDTMRELRASGRTLLLTTHDMVEADELCDHIAIVDHGEVIAQDTPRGLRSVLPSEAGTDLVVEGDGAAAAEAAGRVAGVQGADVLTTSGDRATVRCFGDADPIAVATAVRDAGSVVVELRRLEGSLEDVFMHLTGREMR